MDKKDWRLFLSFLIPAVWFSIARMCSDPSDPHALFVSASMAVLIGFAVRFFWKIEDEF